MSFTITADGQTIRKHSADSALEIVKQLGGESSQVLDLEITVTSERDEDEAVRFSLAVLELTGDFPVFTGSREFGDSYNLYANISV